MSGYQETPGGDFQRHAEFSSSVKTLAHISDLHIGKSAKRLNTAKEIYAALIASTVDLTVVTGDITEHGRTDEYRLFEEIFNDLIVQGKLFVVPGNHDRWGDDLGQRMMNGVRIETVCQAGVCLIRVDSTEPRNRIRISGHGDITEGMFDAIERAILGAAQNDLVVIALHHHLLPQPEDLWIEKVSNWLRLPFAKELRAGQELIERLQGKCNLILHGHRHELKETTFPGERVLSVYNAGSTTQLGGFRIFTHRDGRIICEPRWVDVR